MSIKIAVNPPLYLNRTSRLGRSCPVCRKVESSHVDTFGSKELMSCLSYTFIYLFFVCLWTIYTLYLWGYTPLLRTYVIWSSCEHGMCPLGSQSQFVNINCTGSEKKLEYGGSVQRSPALLKTSIYITSFSHILAELLECQKWKMEAVLLDRLVSREFSNILLFRHSLNDCLTLVIVESTENMGKG